MASRISLRGFVTSPLFWLGLLITWILFQNKKTTLSPAQILEIKKLINQKIQAAGYSSRQASWWETISNFETDVWRSKLCVQYNNLFGMKWYDGAPYNYVQIGKDKWAYPTDYTHSVDIQIAYLKRKKFPKDFEDFYDMVGFMKSKGYFEEPLEEYYNGASKRL